jgi:putative redox protein
MSIKTTTVTAITGPLPYETKIVARNHLLISDEPTDNGGGDLGMKPHELLLAALTSCVCITIKMYVARKEWKLEQIRVESLMERKEESGAHSTNVILELMLIGELDDNMKQRILEIGGRCPIHKALNQTMNIEIRLK